MEQAEQQVEQQFDDILPLDALEGAKALGLSRDDIDDPKINQKLKTIYNHYKSIEIPPFYEFVADIVSRIGKIDGIEPLDRIYLHIYQAEQEKIAKK